jgi:hypothetical protein
MGIRSRCFNKEVDGRKVSETACTVPRTNMLAESLEKVGWLGIFGAGASGVFANAMKVDILHLDQL